ncbi:MAG: hypothetical protein ACXVMS_16735 [Flavisolibacter sp.]
MGRSKTIEEKMKDDEKFREFMDSLQDSSKKEEDRISTEMDAAVKKHYEGNGWDYARLFGNKQSDYQNYDDWSLSRVIKIIDSIGAALDAGDYPSAAVPGSEKAEKSTIKDAKEFLGAFAGDYSLIISRVKALISGVLSQFAVASKVTRKTDMRDMPLSGGLHLFFGSSGSVYTQNTFFTNQYIGSFQIVFATYMSVKEAEMIALQQILLTTEQELVMLNDLILAIREQQSESLNKIMKEDPKDFLSTKAAYDVMLDSVKLDRAKLMEEFEKYNQVTKTIDKLLSRIDLSEFTHERAAEDALKLDQLFNKWEVGVARRYIREKLANKKPEPALH